MKKKFVIILSIQTILVALFFIYAFIQKLEADKQRDLSDKRQQLHEQQFIDMTKEMDKLKKEIEDCR